MARMLVAATATLEMAAGWALFAAPAFSGHWLFDADLNNMGTAVVRFAGGVLFALGAACWPNGDGVTAQAMWGLFAYNLLAAPYLSYLRLGAGFDGHLLLPASALHGVLALLLGCASLHRAIRGVTLPPRTSS